MAAETSVWSYQRLKDEGAIGPKQELVLAYIKKHPGMSDRQISLGLGLKINQVTGRRNELVGYGLVIPGELAYDEVTNRMVHTWLPVGKQMGISQYVREEKKKEGINDTFKYPLIQ